MSLIMNKLKSISFLMYTVKRKVDLFKLHLSSNHLKNRELKNTYTNKKMAKIQEVVVKSKFNLKYDKKKLYGYTQGSPYFFGYVILGNIYFDFVHSLIKEIKQDKIEKIYFLSRDGEIIKKVYDKMRKFYPELPASSYLYASRRSLNVLSITSIKYAIKLMQTKKFETCKIEDILYNRFGCDKEEVRSNLKLTAYENVNLDFLNKNQIEKVMLLLKPIIMKRIEHERKSLIDYYKKEGLLSKQKMAIVDIGHEGSLQKALYKYLGKKITGYYFATFHEIKDNVEKYGMKTWGYVGNKIISKLNFYKSNILFLENIFLNSEKSFTFIENNKIHTVEEKKSNRSEFAKKVHSGIVDYIEEMVDFIAEDIKNTPLEENKKYLMKNLLNLIQNPTVADVEIFKNIIFENQYSCVSDRYLIDDKQRSKSIWQEGYIVSKKAL